MGLSHAIAYGSRPEVEHVALCDLNQELARHVAAEGLKLEGAEKTFELQPEASASFAFPVLGPTEAMQGYPVTVNVETDLGKTEWTERISAAVIGRGTPQIDGDLADWGKLGAIPVFLSNSGETLRGAFDEQKP
jgi:hypothetical protein